MTNLSKEEVMMNANVVQEKHLKIVDSDISILKSKPNEFHNNKSNNLMIEDSIVNE
jgi:hypothetical protein